MNNKFDELTKSMAQSITGRTALRRLIPIAGMAVACFGMVQGAYAQTSTVCDAAGDAVFSNGKGGPQVPGWLDVVQATISDSGDAIVFTITVNAPVPAVPAWSGNEEGGQFWWGWRITGDFTHLTIVKGCILSNGKALPAGYFLDLIYSIQTGSFRARLLDDALCIDSEVPFGFSPDRTQISMVVPKALFNNTAIMPDPNRFQYFAGTRIFKPDTSNNSAFFEIDNAPDQGGGSFAVGTWSSSSNTSYGCP
jgi:hypothetical protein